jgi:hypothetical protein
MEPIHFFTKIICFFNNLYFYLLILLVLLIAKKNQLVYSTLVTSSCSFLINSSLKLLFKIPMMPHVGNGYAFPSGHTQMATVFLGWLAWHQIYPKQYFYFLILLTGFSIYDQNYHTPIEILAGFVTGFAIVMFFLKTSAMHYKIRIFVFNTLLFGFCAYNHYKVNFLTMCYAINSFLLLLPSLIARLQIKKKPKKRCIDKKGL